MFRKCLKYDLRSIWRVWKILACCMVGLGIAGSLAVRGILETMYHLPERYTTTKILLSIVLGIMAIAAFLGVLVGSVVTIILVYVRFYKHFFSDEGYLTFTLPVKRCTLYASKSLNALIFSAATVGIILIDVLLAMLIIPSPYSPNFAGISCGPFALTAYQMLGGALSALWSELGGWMIVYALEGLLLVIVFQLLSNGLTQLCITLGAIIAKKHKFLAAIGFYYGVQSVLTGVVQVSLFIGSLFMMPGAAYLISRMHSPFQMQLLIAVLLLLSTVILSVIACILHFIALDKLERRLNLA